MRQHLLEHPRIAVPWHHLKLVTKVAVVGIGSCRNACRDGLVETGGINAPLLAGVPFEESLVQLSADPVHYDVFRRTYDFNGLTAIFIEGLDLLFGLERQSVKF